MTIAAVVGTRGCCRELFFMLDGMAQYNTPNSAIGWVYMSAEFAAERLGRKVGR